MKSKALTNQKVLYNFSPFDNLITMYLLIALLKYIINHLYLDKKCNNNQLSKNFSYKD